MNCSERLWRSLFRRMSERREATETTQPVEESAESAPLARVWSDAMLWQIANGS